MTILPHRFLWLESKISLVYTPRWECGWNIHVGPHPLCVCMLNCACLLNCAGTCGGQLQVAFSLIFWDKATHQTHHAQLLCGCWESNSGHWPSSKYFTHRAISLALVFLILLSTDKLCSKVAIWIGISTKLLNVFWYDGRKLGTCSWLT